MQPVDYTETFFRGRAQREKFEVLAQRNMAMTIYYDGLTMDSLGIHDSVLFLFNQLGWENVAIRRRFVTYRELTLEFLSSLVYIPDHGYGSNAGLIIFRLFGNNYTFSRRDLADILGFPSGPFVFTTTQEELMDIELNYFWGSLTGNNHPEPNDMHSDEIHNHVIHYFHKILAHTLFGKEENNTLVSKDELFIIYCASQGRPVNAVTFMMETFSSIAQEPNTPIIMGGLVTMIADDIGLR